MNNKIEMTTCSNISTGAFIVGIMFGIFVSVILYINPMEVKLIELGYAQYNPVSGDFELIQNKE